MDVTADLRFAINEETQNGRRFVAAVQRSNTLAAGKTVMRIAFLL